MDNNIQQVDSESINRRRPIKIFLNYYYYYVGMSKVICIIYDGLIQLFMDEGSLTILAVYTKL